MVQITYLALTRFFQKRRFVMARSFTNNDVNRLLERTDNVMTNLINGSMKARQLSSLIKENIDKYVAAEMYKILQEVPIDDLNREHSGFRIKALKDAGINTMADLNATSTYNLSSIRGISQDTAVTMKRIGKEYVAKTMPTIKLRLSTDKKTRLTGNIVGAIYALRIALPAVRECKRLIDCNALDVKYAKEDIVIGSSTIKWIFSGKTKKRKAEQAYQALSVIIDEQLRPQAQKQLSVIHFSEHVAIADAWIDFSLHSVEYFNIIEEIAPGVLGTSDELYGLPEDLAREIQNECFFPEGLLCTLRRYQEWGVKYILHQEKVLLGDEMGLGKTIQAIATMVSLCNTGSTHFIVVCPASVLVNWCKEIQRHSLLKVTKVHGADRKNAFCLWRQQGGVAVTTYETTGRLDLPNNFSFDLVVVDEAHYIKNPEAQRTKNTIKLCQHSKRLLFMTGTALENRVSEMIALIQILQPNIAAQVKGISFMSSAKQFRDKVAPVYYRRKREDVLTELPELIENQEWCTLNQKEEYAYELAVLSKNFMAARRVSWSVDDLNYSSKARRMLEIIEEAEDDGRKVIIFSFFRETINKIANTLSDRCAGIIHGSIPPAQRQAIIDNFDGEPAGSVLVCQIQSGGTGLNIQSASVVIICEPQYKPSIENQAISRAYRMGQIRNVLVYRLLCENTIDERLVRLLEEKQRIFDAFADKSSAAAAAAKADIAIDDKRFGKLIKEEIERIKAKNPALAAKVEREQHKNALLEEKSKTFP